MSGFKKMTLVAYSDEKFNTKVPGGEYVTMLNPESLKWGRSIQYNEEQAIDSSAPSQKYNKTASERLSFELVIDCTGVVDSTRVDLPSEIAKFSSVVYEYNGNIHRPNFVIIYWGKSLAFKCVLTSYDTTFTYFRPDGTPLRAKISLEFRSYIDLATLAKQDDKNSPDITHLVDVVEGDNLPQISHKVYRSPDYYVQIAQVNKLNKFRHLHAGTQLIVPPLTSASVGEVA